MTSAITNSDVGDYEITVTGNDGHSDTTTDTNVFNITVATNQPPSVNETIPQLTFTIDRNSNYTISANAFSDPESDTLTYSVSSPGVTFFSYHPTLGKIFINDPNIGEVGTYSFTVSASDGIAGNAAATQTVSF